MTLHPFQSNDIEAIFRTFETQQPGFHLLYQLPTGGGKTVIFTQIAKRFIEQYAGRVLILTHRNELCDQTARTLSKVGVASKVIKSSTRIQKQETGDCWIAMVETLNNRMEENKISITGIKLIIVDEAHHNSFRKLLEKFPDAMVLGVTATPLSSDRSLPLNDYYHSLLVGESIPSLIEKGHLAKPRNVTYSMDLQSLAKGSGGDFTVSSSDALYTTPALLALIVKAYETQSLGRKTLIFNNGIVTSQRVLHEFERHGYPIRHLDNHTPKEERKEILQWFKKTKGAILTSVSILTTGFDEPSVQTVILNRATTSLTLYHQMVGRGARHLRTKKTFTIIDLGNNTERFGDWRDPIDWMEIFNNPEAYHARLDADVTAGSSKSSAMSAELRSKFPNSLEVGFDIVQAFDEAAAEGRSRKTVIELAIRQHAQMCLENAQSISEAVQLAKDLSPEIILRTKQFASCLGNPTRSYQSWLSEDYARRLEGMVRRMFGKVSRAA